MNLLIAGLVSVGLGCLLVPALRYKAPPIVAIIAAISFGALAGVVFQ